MVNGLENGLVKIISIADIHFGAVDPLYEYNILRDQFINRISILDFDIIALCGDLFDSKFMSNNPIISYAITFVDDLVNLCRSKNASIIIIDGTQSHDNGQLSLFYHYLSDNTIDFRIVEKIQFEYVKGLRILCIPERYGIPEEEYKQILFYSGAYDICLLHGTFKGSYKGSEIATLNSNHAPVFSIGSFINCKGPIIMGHYHINGCYESYAYYNGSPLRYKFGEEEPKGFLITIYNPYNRYHLTRLIEIKSHSYITININNLLNNDPKNIIEYIKHYRESHNIDYIRVQFNNANENMQIVRSYFRNNPNVVLQELDRKSKALEQIDQSIIEQNSQYSYIIDNELDDYTKFVMYINQNEGEDFITVDELINILEDKI